MKHTLLKKKTSKKKIDSIKKKNIPMKKFVAKPKKVQSEEKISVIKKKLSAQVSAPPIEEKKPVLNKKIPEKPSLTKGKKTVVKIPKVTHAPVEEEKHIEVVVEEKTPESIIPVQIPEILPVVEEKISENVVKQKKTLETPDDTEDRNKVEALLFANGKYIDEASIAELCDIDKRRVKKILEQLREYYANKNSALAIFQEDNSWKINVREKYLSLVRKIVADTELPKSVMETLAVIAWKTPIYQAEVVRIRGNKCYDHIEELENAGFITKEKKGRSYVLKTTDKFFTYFEIDHGNLKSVFESAKVPVKEEQQTLEETKIPEDLDVTKKIEQIEVKKWSETEEERDFNKNFLDQMDSKIKDVQERTVLLEQEIPSLRIKPTETSAENSPPENPSENMADTPEVSEHETLEETVQNNSPDAPTDISAETKHRPKSMTKKQLEKKFKDELLRVREKMEKK